MEIAVIPTPAAIPQWVRGGRVRSGTRSSWNGKVEHFNRTLATEWAYRRPFISNDERAAQRVAQATADPAIGAPELWTYLDVEDAARATWLAATVSVRGFHAVFVAAPDTFVPYPTADLVAEFHPDAELRAAMPGRVAPLDLRAAKRLLGFEARHLLNLEMQPWRREA